MKKKKSTKKDEDSRGTLGKFILPVIVIVVVIIIFLLMKGKTTTTGENPDNIRTESLICENKHGNFEKVKDMSPRYREIMVSMIFDQTSSLQSISLKYTMEYDDPETTEKGRVHSRVSLSEALIAQGYGSFEFDSKVSKSGNTVYADLYAKKQELTLESAPFFMIKTDGENLPSTLSEYRKNYESQAFTCRSSVDKQ